MNYKYILGIDPGERTGFVAVDARGLYLPVAGVDTIGYERTSPANKSERQLLSELYLETSERVKRLLGYAGEVPVIVCMDAPLRSRFANYFAYELRGVVKLAVAEAGLSWYQMSSSEIHKLVVGSYSKDSNRRKIDLRAAVVESLAAPAELIQQASEHDIDAAAAAIAFTKKGIDL